MLKESIAQLISGQSLSTEQAVTVMDEIMTGTATPAQIGALVIALRIKGETVDEIIGFAKTMRARAVTVQTDGPVIDVVGTGGDGSGTFNVSTAAAFVAAAAGLKVAKHGNRAMSSHCGSADVLEALGVRIDFNAEQVATCLKEVGISFMFAPAFHPAMKHAAGPRREIGIRTIFNILGPLTNPAGAQAQLTGVPDKSLVEKLALALQGLGCHHALVVHGDDGLDEITTSGKTHVCEIKGTAMQTYTISPEDFGISRAGVQTLKGGNAQENAEILRGVFAGTPGARRDFVVINSAAALLAGDKVETLQQGLTLAKEIIDSGSALRKLQELVAFSRLTN